MTKSKMNNSSKKKYAYETGTPRKHATVPARQTHSPSRYERLTGKVPNATRQIGKPGKKTPQRKTNFNAFMRRECGSLNASKGKYQRSTARASPIAKRTLIV